MRRPILALVASAAVLAAVPAAHAQAPASGLQPYRQTAAWVDIYDRDLMRDPEAVVAQMAGDGVRTLYLETGNYRQGVDVVRRAITGRYVEAAHAAGISVVAWYLPGYDDLRRDLRRAVSAIRFTTPTGQRFDSFALDVEATVVRSIPRRSTRAVTLARRLRRAVPSPYVLGAIVPDSDARYWLPFPYAALAPSFDVWLPMAYFTFRTRGESRVRALSRRNVEAIRDATGSAATPVHVIGGLAAAASRAEVRGLVAGAREAGADGVSLYSFDGMKASYWTELARLPVPLLAPVVAPVLGG